jgi:hypothetical protein
VRLPNHLVDLSRVRDLNLSGRGGRERDISALLPKWIRASATLYDYHVAHDGDTIRLEVKKQANLQWFDSGKYYHLSKDDRDIRVMFLIHDEGDIVVILVAILGELIDWLCKNRSKDGWTDEVMKVAADFKNKYPSLQFKARAHIAAISEEAPQLFDVLYRKNT